MITETVQQQTVLAALALANRAPSVHNSQPWRWQLADHSVHLYADLRRWLPATDPEREAAQISRLRSLAEEARLDPAFAETFLTFIIEEVVRHHRKLQASAAE